MSTTIQQLITIEEFMELPTDEPWEVWEGELRIVGGAGIDASAIAAGIVFRITGFVRANDLGVVVGADGTFIFSHDPLTIIVPDVSFISWDRLPGRVRPTSFGDLTPDLAVEVRSPSDRRGDILAKLERYRRAGVPLVWWVHPAKRQVEVYRDGELVATLGEGDELDGEAILPGFRLPIAEIFA